MTLVGEEIRGVSGDEQCEVFYGGDYPQTIPPCKQNVGQYFLDIMANNPNKIAQIDPVTKKLQTYSEIRADSIRCALQMRQNGVKRADVVMVCGRIHINLITPIFSAMYLGAVINPLHPDYSRNEILRLIKLTEPKIIFCDDECKNLMADLIAETQLQCIIVTFETDFQSYIKPHKSTDEDNFVAETVDVHNDLLCIICTSGTSGSIKGVTKTHNAYYLAVNAHTILEEGDGPMLYYSPISWISAILFIGIMFWNKESKITCEYDPKLNLEIMANYNIKWTFSSALKLMEIIRHPDFPKYSSKIINNLKYIYFGGSVVTSQQIIEFRTIFYKTDIFNFYGCTEMSIFHAYFNRTNEDLKLNVEKIVSSGRPFLGTYWKLIDPETGLSVGRNQEAELLVKGVLLMQGYYKDPEATAAAIDKDGWFHTGDIVIVDEDDCLFVVGRTKELLKYKGWQVSPTELEYILESHPDIENACVVGKPHEIDGDVPLAFVVKKISAENLTESEITEFVAKQVADYQKLRGGIIFINSLPRTVNGKIRRNELKKLLKQLEENEEQ